MGFSSPIERFLKEHKNQLLASGIPELYWEILYKKLFSHSFDAGKVFQLVKIDYDEEKKPYEPSWAIQTLVDLDKNDSNNIFLIDHAWTYPINQARLNLEQDQLRNRMASILDIKDNRSKQEVIKDIFENMWRINGSYCVKSLDGTKQELMWFVMDEVGCAVLHSDKPNCRMVNFVYLNEGVYTLLFIQENVLAGELLYRDFAEGVQDPVLRRALLLPWVPASFTDIDIKPPIPGSDYYLNGHITENLPDLDKLKDHPRKDKYLCFSQYSLVRKHLTDPKFELTDNQDEADIWWFTEHFRDFKSLCETPHKFVNQFPYEYIITVKDLLCMTCRRYKNYTSNAPWVPITYNLVNEVGNFVSYFQQREEEGLDNYWIIKPYNLARGMDIHITNNLNYIMRLPTTGPKIAQKYLTNPVLFHRSECEGKVKFDVRYVILLKSVEPLQVYVYKNFFLRFANKPFSLEDFDDYEKHFTVMNYTENVVLKHLKCEDFKIEWEKQYSDHQWNHIEEDIMKMIKEIMECAIAAPPPCGIAHSPQSRALYAADLMLDWENRKIQPKILEINFMPDCERACNYYPDFYNDIFKLLFLNEESDIFYKL